MVDSVVNSAQSRFFDPAKPWVYAPQDVASKYDGTQVLEQTVKLNGVETDVTAPAIDCSHLVQQSLLAAGYDVDYATTAQLAKIINGTSTSSDYSITAIPKAGDIIVFQGHTGIVQTYDPTTGNGTFLGAQSSGLGQNVAFGTNAPYWKTSKEVGFLTPNQSSYDPAAATSVLDTINTNINNNLPNYDIQPYFGAGEINSGGTPPSSGTFGGGGGPEDDGSPEGSTWLDILFDWDDAEDWSSDTLEYNSHQTLTSSTYNLDTGSSRRELFSPTDYIQGETQYFTGLDGTGWNPQNIVTLADGTLLKEDFGLTPNDLGLGSEFTNINGAWTNEVPIYRSTLHFDIGDFSTLQDLRSSVNNEVDPIFSTGPVDNSYFPTLNVYNFGGSLDVNPLSAEYSTAVSGGALLADTDYLVTFPSANDDGLFSNSAAGLIAGGYRIAANDNAILWQNAA